MSHPTLGFASRKEFLSWTWKTEGAEYCQARSDREICEAFICRLYGPQNLSAGFRESIRLFMADEPRFGRECSPNHRFVFALPPCPVWTAELAVPSMVGTCSVLYLTTANADAWRAGEWREFGSYLFYANRAELRAAYRAALEVLAGRSAAHEMKNVRLVIAGNAHAARFGLRSEPQPVEAKS